MLVPKRILAISGSTRENSVNELILQWMARHYHTRLDITIYNRIAELPHFRSDLVDDRVPAEVKEFYRLIAEVDGVIICTPEYVFSLPGTFKNALEWTVSTTLFTNKAAALIVASSLGEKAFESLQLVMKTLGARFQQDATLLITGVKAKINQQGALLDESLQPQFDLLIESLVNSIA